jgi:short chain dehydrogenase
MILSENDETGSRVEGAQRRSPLTSSRNIDNRRNVDVERLDEKTVKLSGVCGEVLKRYPQLHALVNNAGVGFGPLGGVRQVSADGIELRFAANHLAGYLLARRLTDRLVSSAPARIVQVTSISQQALDPAGLFTSRHYDGVTAYRRSRSGGRSGALKSGDGPARASPKPGGTVALHTTNRGNFTVHHVPQSRGRSHIAALHFSHSASVPCQPSFAGPLPFPGISPSPGRGPSRKK